MRRLRLLAIIEAETITGPAKNLLQFAETIRSPAFNLDLGIATFIRQARGVNLFVQTAEAAGIPVFPILEAGRFDRSTIPALRDIAARFRPNLIQTHAVKSHFLLRLAGLHRSVPWIAFHHGYTWPDLRARIYNELDRWSLRVAERTITVSRPFRAQLAERGVKQDRIDIIHNAIDPQWGRGVSPEAITALRKNLNLTADQHVILIVGRLSAEKDHISLLRALAEVRQRHPDYRPHLLVVGDGPERPRIEQTIASLNLASDVTLVGQQRSAEPFYAIATIAVLSSLSEGSPNALLEAMAAGVPAIATRVGGIPEIVTDGDSALLVEPADPAGLADAISKLLSDNELAKTTARRAYDIVQLNHSPIARARRLYEVYTHLAAPDTRK